MVLALLRKSVLPIKAIQGTVKILSVPVSGRNLPQYCLIL